MNAAPLLRRIASPANIRKLKAFADHLHATILRQYYPARSCWSPASTT